MPTSCPPSSFEEIALTDSVVAWGAALDGLGDWWAGALRRGTTAPQLTADWIRWWSTIADRRPPRWSSAHEIVFEAPVARLRDFSTSPKSRVLPTLVLPPQAGHDSCIVDYSLEQS